MVRFFPLRFCCFVAVFTACTLLAGAGFAQSSQALNQTLRQLARDMAQTEQNLAEAHATLQTLATQAARQEQRLQADVAQFQRNVMELTRLSRRPQEVQLMGDMFAQAARQTPLLRQGQQGLLANLEAQRTSLSALLAAYQTQAEVVNKIAALKARQQAQEKQLSQARRKRLNALKIEENQLASATGNAVGSVQTAAAAPARLKLPKGQKHRYKKLPVSGALVHDFNEPDPSGQRAGGV